MHYLDTSVIAALLLRDPESDRVEKMLRTPLAGETLLLSWWTGVEVFSAIARRLRMRQIGAQGAARARLAYEQQFVANHAVIGIAAADFDRARQLLSVDGTALRGGDALHLAIAVNHHVTSFRTLDKVLRRAAQQTGLHAPAI
jgi:predicted nucleic acid-binding protein